MMLTVLTCVCLTAEYDVVVYGGTSAGVAAGLQAARMGKSVVVIEPSQHLGGLTSGGLGWTDSGDKNAVGGIAREFYRRVKKHYDDPTAWKHEQASGYKFYRSSEDAMWTFEPKVAEAIVRAMLAERQVPVVYGERLDLAPAKGVQSGDGRIRSIAMESGKVFAGKMFVDATYEGDLLAMAGVSYHVGRESNRRYGETLNGVQRARNLHNHRFLKNVDPFVRPGDRSSGLLPGILAEALPADGSADHRLQAYCFRMCLTDAPANRLPFVKPADYDEREYELLLRNFEAGDLRLPMKPDYMPNRKTDVNNNCAVSTDYIGQNYDYPEADYAGRAKIVAKHLQYQQGLMWTLAHHPRTPATIRKQMEKWGLSADEFQDSGGWPHQIYVREARRMVSDYVMTEADCRRTRPTPEPVGMGSYNMDSHNCTRFVDERGYVQNEGDVQESPGGPYQIGYRSIVPKERECQNLLAPVCLASSHIAYGSIRMEPVFFVLGQSAATAAVHALDGNTSVQKIDYRKLAERLKADGQVLDYRPARSAKSLDPNKLPGIVVDDAEAVRHGFDGVSQSVGPYIGAGYRHDNNERRGEQWMQFRVSKLEPKKYSVRIAYTPNPNRATNAKVTLTSGRFRQEFVVNQRQKPKDGAWHTLSELHLIGDCVVTIANEGADGYVVADAVQWLPSVPGENEKREESPP